MTDTPSMVTGAPQPGAKGDMAFTLTALAVLFLTVVPVGTAVFYLGFVRGDSPCVMCWEQRIGMILIALVGLFVLRYGPRPKYVGMAVLIAGYGMLMALRHVGMHGARDIGQGFSMEIMGAHTYTWALFTYWVCVLAMGALLLLVRPANLASDVRELNGLERITGWAFVVVVAGNIVQAFASTGPPPFMGQSDPIRFSFNPRYWHWSLEEWRPPIKVAFRGRWAVDKPDVATANTDQSAQLLTGLPTLAVKSRTPLGVPLDDAPTDLAYDPASDRFLITTASSVYLTDGALAALDRQTTIDVGYSVDLGRFAGAAFLDRGELIAVGENKSYVVLKPNDKANADSNFRYFLKSRDKFDEVRRSRFGTVRARLHYILSAAYDPSSNSIYTVTVPSNRASLTIVSRFSRRDFLLSEEFFLLLDKGVGPLQAKDRSVDEFMVSGATIVDGQLYAVSAAYGALLTIDLAGHRVTSIHVVPGLVHPVGIAAKQGDLFILGSDRTVTVVARPVSNPLPVDTSRR